jgi:hypothetical protein
MMGVAHAGLCRKKPPDSVDYDKSPIRTDALLFACDAKSNSGMTIGFRVDLKSYVDDENWMNCKILVSQSAHL